MVSGTACDRCGSFIKKKKTATNVLDFYIHRQGMKIQKSIIFLCGCSLDSEWPLDAVHSTVDDDNGLDGSVLFVSLC